jgi:hypothetical protein
MSITTIDHHICGIPCKIEVTYFHHQEPWRGSAHNCPSADDYYGFTEIEYNVLDRKGYAADWLARKITSEIDSEIRDAIFEQTIQDAEPDEEKIAEIFTKLGYWNYTNGLDQ